MTQKAIPISCDLTVAAAAGQVLEWKDLQGYATHVETLPTGARMRFPAELEPRVADLASRESACCSFLDITVSVDDDTLVLEVTSENPLALPVISAVTGAGLL